MPTNLRRHIEQNEREPVFIEMKLGLSLKKPTLVRGIGHLLMGDEGVGVQAFEHLKKDFHLRSPARRGNMGLYLLGLFKEYEPIILIEATMNGKSVVTITLTESQFSL